MEKIDRRKKELQERVACVLLLIAGLGFTLFVLFTTPRSVEEGELVTVRGIAVDAVISSQVQYKKTKQILTFSLGGYHFNYTSREKGFRDLLEAIQNGNELTISVHPDPRPAIFANVPNEIYTLTVNGQSVLTYSDSISKQRVGLIIVYGIGGTMFLCGVVGSWWYFLRRRDPCDHADEEREDAEQR